MLNYFFCSHLPTKQLYTYVYNTVDFLRIPPLHFCSFHALSSCLNHNCLIQNLGSIGPHNAAWIKPQEQHPSNASCKSNIINQKIATHVRPTKQLYHQSIGSKCSSECWGAYEKWVYHPEIPLVGDRLMSCQLSSYQQPNNSPSRTTNTKKATSVNHYKLPHSTDYQHPIEIHTMKNLKDYHQKYV